MLAALLLGFAGGGRTFLPLAAVALAAWRGALVPPADLGFFASPWAAGGLTLLALAELVGDKHPRTPSRTRPGPFVARIASGALAGAAVMAAQPLAGVLVGGAAGAASCHALHALRARMAAALGRDLPAALLEDLLALALACGGIALAVA